MMKIDRAVFFSLIAWSALATIASASTNIAAISTEQADGIIAAEMTAQAEREAEGRAELESVPASGKWFVDQGDGRTVFRRIAPPLPETLSSTQSHSVKAATELDPSPVSRRQHHNLTLFVTVFDSEMTEIRVAPLKEGVTVMSNVPFTHLPAMETVFDEEAVFSFFSFVEQVNTEERPGRKVPDPALLPADDSAYTVLSEADEVPDGLYEALDALHDHYIAHETEFAARAQRAEALRAARERYLEENPPEPRETVINFFPVQSRLHGTGND